MNKSPKAAYNPDTNKKPKRSEDPEESAYGKYLSWHFQQIDFDGPHGFRKTFSGINYVVNENLLENLIKVDVPENLFDSLLTIQGKEFDSLNSLINELTILLNDPIEFTSIQELFLNIERKNFFNQIYDKVVAFEQKTWNEILTNERKKNHEVSIGSISKEAQKRLRELQFDDIENLVSLRFSGRNRIWGIRFGSIFRVLWWDPDHEVYPSEKKHT